MKVSSIEKEKFILKVAKFLRVIADVQTVRCQRKNQTAFDVHVILSLSNNGSAQCSNRLGRVGQNFPAGLD